MATIAENITITDKEIKAKIAKIGQAILAKGFDYRASTPIKSDMESWVPMSKLLESMIKALVVPTGDRSPYAPAVIVKYTSAPPATNDANRLAQAMTDLDAINSALTFVSGLTPDQVSKIKSAFAAAPPAPLPTPPLTPAQIAALKQEQANPINAQTNALIGKIISLYLNARVGGRSDLTENENAAQFVKAAFALLGITDSHPAYGAPEIVRQGKSYANDLLTAMHDLTTASAAFNLMAALTPDQIKNLQAAYGQADPVPPPPAKKFPWLVAAGVVAGGALLSTILWRAKRRR